MSEQYAEQADVVVDNDTSALDAEPSVILDEDRLGADPLEDGMDTAEGYSRTVRLGGTQSSEERDDIDHRLPQEEPDVGGNEEPGRPIAATPAMELDESVDDPEHAVDGVGDLSTTGAPIDDPIDPEGAVELLTEAGGEPGSPTEGAEQQALHVEQES